MISELPLFRFSFFFSSLFFSSTNTFLSFFPLTDLSQELVKVHVRKQADDFEERRQYQLKKQEKHQTPSKVWMEKAANTDYEVCLLCFAVFFFY